MLKRGPKPKKIVDTKWSSDLAYAVGLLATDGSLAKKVSLVDLTSKDIEQLKNFNRCIGVNFKISPKPSGRGERAWRIQFKNRIFYDFLISIGITPAKSKTISEIRLPNKYFFDFLRGCFDGDGSFYSYWDKRWRSSFMFYLEFTSASLPFINWIRNKNQNNLGIRGHITKDKGRAMYQLKYAKKESLILIKKMYYSKKVVSLSRKRLKIAKVLDTIGVSVGHLYDPN